MHLTPEHGLWAVFLAGIALMMALDMGVFHRKAHTVSLKEAACWSAVWVTLALLFGAGVWYFDGAVKGQQFLAGYVVELSLSVDNVFLFCVIFSYFQVPPLYQHRVLFIGILSAVILRGIMIVSGAALLERFHWMIYVFGAFLIFTGIKMFLNRDGDADVSDSKLLKFLRRVLPVTDEYDGQKFFTRIDGRLVATRLLLVLAMVEMTDVVFALDSIPAIFGITRDGFIVFTSNILAILGLRSLYFLLSGVMDMFHYLAVGLSFILTFIGVKMVIEPWYHIEISHSLAVIGGILTISVIASLIRNYRQSRLEQANAPDTIPDPVAVSGSDPEANKANQKAMHV